ncbi:MAG: cytochrome c oxidase subunit II [Actinomycetes bacterium]
MSTVDERTPEAEEPENPTNRPPGMHLASQWMNRPYARRIILLTVIISAVIIALTFVMVAFMNLSGGPASDIQGEIEKTMYVLTFTCAPLMGFTLAIITYSWWGGWGKVKSEEEPTEEGPAIRTNGVAVVAWITVCSLLAAFLVIWGLVELATITASSYGSVAANQQPNSAKAIDINVTGQQWLWSFEYPDQGKITSSELVVPVNVPLYFNVTSLDVIHSFWVVEAGVKIDVNPGAITNTGFTPNKLGTFNIRCAELCGLHHAYMETNLRVVTQEQFDSWVREQGGARTS